MDESTRQAMDLFFRDAEQRAYLMAMTLTRNHHDALEVVQDSMLRLVQHYCDRQPDEWGPLFHRILQNRVRDWYRRNRVRQLLGGLLPWPTAEASAEATAESAEQRVIEDAELTAVLDALQVLPLRQQQTFLLRAWQGMSTRETAFALSISENSVKTHYARATRALRAILGDDDVA